MVYGVSVLAIQEWERLKAMGLANAAGLVSSHHVVCLLEWVQAAGADLTLVEALQGSPLEPNESLATALPSIFVFDTSGRAFLSRSAPRKSTGPGKNRHELTRSAECQGANRCLETESILGTNRGSCVQHVALLHIL